MADAFEKLYGLKCSFKPLYNVKAAQMHQSLEYLVCKHPELTVVKLFVPVYYDFPLNLNHGLTTLFRLSNLQVLHLENFGISGESLKPLEEASGAILDLNLSGCKGLTDRGLSNILMRCGSSLTSLNVSKTQITGCGVHGPALNQLETLNLRACRSLKDRGLHNLIKLCGNGTSLKTLILSHTPATTSGLTIPPLQLEHLNLSGCWYMSDLWVNNLLSVCGHSLKSLNLSSTAITGLGLHSPCPKLEHLNISSISSLTDSGLAHFLRQCGATLKSLNLAKTETFGTDSMGAIFFPALLRLNLHGCRYFTDQDLLNLLGICGAGLKSLDISSTRISGKDIVPAVFELEHLNLSRLFHMTDSGLDNLLGLCRPSLKSLNLSETHIKGTEVTGTFACLEKLVLHDCGSVQDSGLNNLLTSCGAVLKSLDLSETRLTGTEITAVCPQLETLNLSSCYNLRDSGLNTMLSNWGSNLKGLHLAETKIYGTGLSAPCEELEHLGLEQCSYLTDRGLRKMLEGLGCTRLKSLNLTMTKITETAMASLLESYPKLVNLTRPY